FALFQNLMEHMGLESGRLQFSWVSSAESTKFVEVVREVTAGIKELGPNLNYSKSKAKVA
ncbi:MAG: hydrogenase iron-sulfur subunit, partial [Desulfobacterales bacterium]